MFSQDDYQWMSRALELARRGRYTTAPNPCVGAVLVKAGVVVGEGGPPLHSGLGLFNNDQHCIGWNDGRNPLPPAPNLRQSPIRHGHHLRKRRAQASLLRRDGFQDRGRVRILSAL